MIRYEIRAGESAPCELWSIVDNPSFVPREEDFICEGTHTYCALIKDKLEG